MTGAKDIIMTAITFIFDFFDGRIADAVTILTTDIFAAGNQFAPMRVVAEGIRNVVRPISLTVCAVCFLIMFIKMTVTMNILKWEYGLKVLLGFIFARAAMDLAPDLLRGIYWTAAEWIAGAGGIAANTVSTMAGDIENALGSLDWIGVVFLMIMMLIPILCLAVTSILVQIMAYARMFELFFYIAVSPIAFAFLPLDDNRIAKQFVFRFAGVALQGLAIIICIRLYGALFTAIIEPMAHGFVGGADGIGQAAGIMFSMLIGSVLLLISVTKSGQWAKAVFDAA